MAEPFRFSARALRQGPVPEPAFRSRRVVRFHEIDAAGIVFFARVLDYVHDHYTDFLASVGSPLPEVLAARSWAAPIGHVEVDYFEPLRFGDELTLLLAAAHVEGSHVTLAHQVLRHASNRVAAVAQTAHVFVSADTFRPIPVPPALLTHLQALPSAP